MGQTVFKEKSVYALAHLNLPYAPFNETSPRIYKIRPDVVEEWKTWYVEHGEEVTAQLEAEEAERAELEAQTIADAQAKAERYQNRSRNPPTTAPKQAEKPSKAPPSRAIFISLILVTISLVVFLMVRLKSCQNQVADCSPFLKDRESTSSPPEAFSEESSRPPLPL